MADLQNFVMARGAGRAITVPRYTITFEVRDSGTGELLYDHTGGNGLLFPDFILSLTDEQLENLVQRALSFWLQNAGEM